MWFLRNRRNLVTRCVHLNDREGVRVSVVFVPAIPFEQSGHADGTHPTGASFDRFCTNGSDECTCGSDGTGPAFNWDDILDIFIASLAYLQALQMTNQCGL